MSVLDTFRGRRTAQVEPMGDTLEALFAQAEALGKVYVHSSQFETPPRCYNVTIRFMTMQGTSLEAASDFRMALKAALRQALERAETIRAQFK